MEKNITVKELIDGLKKNNNSANTIKDKINKIKYIDYNNSLINALAKDIVSVAYLEDDAIKINTNKLAFLTNTSFIMEFTNIETEDIIKDYNTLVEYGLWDYIIKDNKLYNFFIQAVNNEKDDLLKNLKLIHNDNVDIFIKIISKCIDMFLGSQAEFVGNKENLDNIINNIIKDQDK